MSAVANGIGLTWCRVTIPWSGVPLVECDAPEPVVPVAGMVTFVVEDLIVVATMVRSGEFAGSWQGYGLGGKGKWGTLLPSRAYRSPFGLLNSQIILDAARECGELPPVVTAPFIQGEFYLRRGDMPASQVFGKLPPGTDWWIDPATGVTRVGVRAPSVVAAEFDLMGNNTRQGRLTIATDKPAAFQPGASFVDPLSGAFTVNAVVWEIKGSSVRGEIWTT